MTITSATNRHLTEIRKLARVAGRARTGRFVAEGEDFYAAAHAARITPLYVLCAQGHEAARDAGWLEVAPALLADVSALGSSSRVIGVYEQRWSAPVGPLDRRAVGRRRSRQRRHGDPRGARVRRRPAWPSAPDPPIPTGARRCARRWGRSSGSRSLASRAAQELPGRVVGLAADAPVPLRGPLAGELTLLVGGERGGLPDEVRAQCDELRSIPQACR